MTKIVGFLVLSAVLMCGSLQGQNQSTAQNRVEFEPVGTVAVKPGKTTPVVFTFHVKPGFHINSNKPSTEELIPTQLRFSPPQDLVIAKVQYPAGQLTSFPFDPSEKLSVYSGDVAIKAVVMAQSHAGTGTYTVHGEFMYQACDNNACYPPKKLPVDFNVSVASASHGSTRPRPNKQSPHIH
jgi:DsbC/DsbD-like thiol-disulfide interchange protein